MLDGDLTIQIGSSRVSGWTSATIHRSAENIPNGFEIGLAATSPLGVPAFLEGSPITILIDDDTVLTGYLDQTVSSVEPGDHRLTVSGRGKCSDLVDCSAEWKGSMIQQTDVGDVARKLCTPYGIDVSIRAYLQASQGTGAAASAELPAMGVTLIEAPAVILSEMARYFGVLMYESDNGELVLDRAGSVPASGGFVEGGNITAHSVVRSMAERFSSVQIEAYSVSKLNDVGDDLSLLASASDPNVQRHRLRRAVSSGPNLGPDFAQREATWEVARRAGRGCVAKVTVPGWRDAAGVLWTPNTKAPIHIPSEGIIHQTWIIAEVVFTRDAKGTRTEATLMAPAAFAVEPISINPPGRDVLDATTPAAPATPTTTGT